MTIHFKTIIAFVGVISLLAGCAPSQYKPATIHPAAIPASSTNELGSAPPARPASLALIRTAPTDGLVCEPIPVTLTVSNSGGSVLTGVRIVDVLPAGWVRDDRSNTVFEVSQIVPGDSRVFTYNAHAVSAGGFVSPGEFTGHAKATSAEGVTAEAFATTTIHQPVFVITSQVSSASMLGRKLSATYIITNTGDALATETMLSLPVPTGLTVDSLSGNGQYADNLITWNFGTLDVHASRSASATFVGTTAGDYQFIGTVKGDCATDAMARSRTQVIGVSALSLQKIDGPDPIAVSELTTYTVKVTNQGSAPDTNVAISVEIAPELVPVGSDNRNAVIHDRTVTFPVIPILPAQHAIIYSIVAKGVKAGDGHTKFTLNSAALKSAISAEESTTVY